MGFGAAAFFISALLQFIETLLTVPSPPPVFQAAGLGIGMALILYGVNPSVGVKTKLEWAHINFVGPTAAGVVIAWFAYTSLMEARVINDTVVLYNDAAGLNGKTFADGTRARLVNVDLTCPLHPIRG